jgi:hypothetical protein
MHIPRELLPVVQITLPLIVAILGANWLQNRRLDDIVKRLEVIEGILRQLGERLATIEQVLREHGQRLTRLEDRIPPLVHR